MGKKIKNELLECLGKVYEHSAKCKLDSSFFDKVDEELKYLSNYFNVSKTESFILSVIFALNYKDGTVDLSDLIEYFDCNPMKLLEYSEDLDALYDKGILKKQKSVHRINLTMSNDQFFINEIITEAILNNKSIPTLLDKEVYKDVIELLEYFYKLGQKRDNDEITTICLLAEVECLIFSNLHFPLIKKINEIGFRAEDIYLYIYLIWKTLLGKESIYIERVINCLFDKYSIRINYLQKIISNENKLINEDLIEIVDANIIHDMEIRLSDNSIKIIQELGVNVLVNRKKKGNVVEPSNIKLKTLIFSDEENKQLDLLKTLLQQDKLKKVQHRLENKNLPKGITVLLHGYPGTGKTETVNQVAKATNRNIVKVDISHSKSMWFGESEKIIKQIFTDYKSYAKECEQTPILLFNEADAIISKRNENNTSGISQTENAIQNIILEELENFEGIFFATTNLANNLDFAFERRFLFKIEFKKPNIFAKAKIWNLKLPKLSVSECDILANQFDFSGGQIDNIVRKNEIYEIIHGVSVDFNNILEFCKVEFLSVKNNKPVGFTKS